MRNFKKIVAGFLCFSIILLCGCTADKKGTKKIYGYEFPAVVYDGISVEDCYLYSGEFIEDGTFEKCENVAALKVKNTSLVDIQLIRIKVTTDAKEMTFEISTLLAGETVIVLEQSKQTIEEKEKIVGFDYENRVFFDKNVSLKKDVFMLQANERTINIKNITETEIESDIFVYYKKKDADGNYFGGITFRTKADGLKPGEIKQVSASNFTPDNSEVLFVDYAS